METNGVFVRLTEGKNRLEMKGRKRAVKREKLGRVLLEAADECMYSQVHSALRLYIKQTVKRRTYMNMLDIHDRMKRKKRAAAATEEAAK